MASIPKESSNDIDEICESTIFISTANPIEPIVYVHKWNVMTFEYDLGETNVKAFEKDCNNNGLTFEDGLRAALSDMDINVGFYIGELLHKNESKVTYSYLDLETSQNIIDKIKAFNTSFDKFQINVFSKIDIRSFILTLLDTHSKDSVPYYISPNDLKCTTVNTVSIDMKLNMVYKELSRKKV